MPQGYFITSMLFGNCKQSFPAIPRTKETGRLTCIGSRIEGCLILYKRYSIRFTMRFQICRITLIRDIFHHHMNCDNRKARFIDTYTLTQQFDKRQRIFPSRQSDKDFVPSSISPYCTTPLLNRLSTRRMVFSSSVNCVISSKIGCKSKRKE